jgi:SnoaL-like domain
MPTRERLQEFITTVKTGRYVEAIRDFYDEEATIRENVSAPRVGRDALVRHELAVLSSVKEMRTRAAHTVLLDGDHVAINWEFEITSPEGKDRLLNELVLQVWKGDRILHEQFFYDPGQLVR